MHNGSGPRPRTVVDLVRTRAAQAPTRIAYSYLKDGEVEDGSLTWADVDRRARDVATWLLSRGAPDQRVVLLFPIGLDFITAFFGCLYAGVQAVPAYPLDPLRLARTAARLSRLIADCQPRMVLTTARYHQECAEMPGSFDWAAVEWAHLDDIPANAGADWVPPCVQEDTIAVIQYTSGSTAEPRGVMVSHKNILANENMIQRAHGYDENTTFVSWVPLAHDWGLINSVIQPAYIGARTVLMGTEAFLQQPVRWLRAIARNGPASSGGPNFAYDFCARKIAPDQCHGLDLSQWRWAGVSAGPVRAETLKRFTSVFAPYKFEASAFYSGYGLAEATLLVSDSAPFQFPRTVSLDSLMLQRGVVLERSGPVASTFVSCGQPQERAPVAIVNPATHQECEPDRTGEIWIRGEHVTRGYWNRPAETTNAFRAYTAEGVGPWFRTGDIGFLHQGELFVCGRMKDLIIVRGRNIYPQDIEATAEQSHPSLRLGGTAAFAIPGDDEERVVVVQEIRADRAVVLAQLAEERLIVVQESRAREDFERREITRSIRSAISLEHDVLAHTVVLVKAGSIPKTSSGKLRRQACRELLLGGQLAVLLEDTLQGPPEKDDVDDAGSQSLTPTESTLVELWTHALDGRTAGIHDRFIDFADSITATRFLNRVCETFQIEISIEMLFGDLSTTALLAQFLDQSELSS